MAPVSHQPDSVSAAAVFQTDLNLPGRRQGKVRDIYEIPEAGGETSSEKGGLGRVLMVATDRISAFDVVMPTAIPGKGKILTAISGWWFGFIEQRRLAKTHLIGTDVRLVPAAAFQGAATTPADLEGRIMVARKCQVIPIECVVRGYLEGSGWKEYQQTGAVCGVRLPAGLRQCEQLPQPIFTPATKAPQGEHDENISFERAAAAVGEGLMRRLREISLAIYSAAAEHARGRGIIIADTKFEFGFAAGDGEDEPVLIDEVLTPDSSRFWPLTDYQPGRAQKSFDKQYLREYLQMLVDRGEWNKQAPGPALPAEVVAGTLAKYREARERLTG
jgi:phosphoribosylaminoimidazole-succinocarboxamide synthase